MNVSANGGGLYGPTVGAVRAVDNTTGLMLTLPGEAGVAVARELAVQWAGLGRFARRRVGVTAGTLLAARGLAKVAAHAEAWLALHPGVVPDAGCVAEHADPLAAGWDDRSRPDNDDDLKPQQERPMPAASTARLSKHDDMPSGSSRRRPAGTPSRRSGWTRPAPGGATRSTSRPTAGG